MHDPGRWPPGTQDSIGQVAEFLVWAALITQSGGDLHVFLPTLDRGIDSLVHRRHDGAYLTLQVKSKTWSGASESTIAVLETHLYTNDQLIIGVHLESDRLGDYALVADAATFRKKAGRVLDGSRSLLVADMPLHPIPGHKWSGDLVQTTELAARLGAHVPELVGSAVTAGVPDEDSVVGSWGELEVIRRLQMLADCCLFRPFPDNEMVEVAVHALETGKTIGLQVKTAQLDEPHAYRNILINRSNFTPDLMTHVVALAWIIPERRFHATCLLIPSEVVPSIAGTSGPDYELHFRPDGSSEPSKVDRYRVPLDSLAGEIAKRISS